MSTLHQDNAFLEIALENLPRLLLKYRLRKAKRGFQEGIIMDCINTTDPVSIACDHALNNKKFKPIIDGLEKVDSFKTQKETEVKNAIKKKADEWKHNPKKSFLGKVLDIIVNCWR
jgi:hypothetical protein